MEEDHDRAITNEDTVEEESDILRGVLDEMQEKYEGMKGERDYVIDKQYLAEEEALIFLAHLQACKNEIEMLQEQVEQLQGAGVQ